MTYRKRPLTTRTCTHCHEAYQAVDRRRLYCSSSCKVQACKAKRRHRLAARAQGQSANTTASVQPLAGLGNPKKANLTVAWSASNAALFTVTSVAAQLLVRVGDTLFKSLTTPAAQVPREDPLSWLPAAFVTSVAQRQPLHLTLWGQARSCVELHYLGHTFFYQPVERCLLWAVEPGQYLVLTEAAQIALIAQCEPYQPPQLPSADQGQLWGYSTSPTQPLARPGTQLKDLG